MKNTVGNSCVIGLTILTLAAFPVHAEVHRLFGDSGVPIWPREGVEFAGIYPIDGGEKVALIWKHDRPDRQTSEVCYQIVEHDGSPTFEEYGILSDSRMSNGDPSATTDHDGNFYVIWKSIVPGDTVMSQVHAQKITPEGRVCWGIPTNAIAIVPGGSISSVAAAPDETGGVWAVTREGIVHFDSRGEPEGGEDQPLVDPPDIGFRRIIPDDAGGVWIEYYSYDGMVHYYAYNHLLNNGRMVWDEPQPRSGFDERFQTTLSLGSSIGYQGGLITSLAHSDGVSLRRVAFFDERLEPRQDMPGIEVRRDNSGVLYRMGENLIGWMTVWDEDPVRRLNLMVYNFETREFQWSDEGLDLGSWQRAPRGDMPRVYCKFMGRLVDDELGFWVSCPEGAFIYAVPLLNVPIVRRLGAVTGITVGNSVRWCVPDPIGGGGWIAGDYPYSNNAFYLNRYSEPWAPVSPTGFEVGVPRFGTQSFYLNWFETNNHSNLLFFVSPHSLRQMKFFPNGESQSHYQGREAWVGDYPDLTPMGCRLIGSRLVAVWPQSDEDFGPAPTVGGFDTEGRLLWRRRVAEEGEWYSNVFRINKNLYGDAVILTLIKPVREDRTAQVVLVQIDPASGEETVRWEGPVWEVGIIESQIQSWLFEDNGCLDFVFYGDRDSLYFMKFAGDIHPVIDHPVSRNIGWGGIGELVSWPDGGYAFGCQYWNNNLANLYMLRYNSDGEQTDSFAVYNPFPIGNMVLARDNDWLKSDDRIWVVPSEPLYSGGRDTTGIQLFDAEMNPLLGRLGRKLTLPNGGYASYLRGIPDSIGGAWIVANHQLGGSTIPARVFHLNRDGEFDDQWPLEGVAVSEDSDYAYLYGVHSLKGGDLGVLVTQAYPRCGSLYTIHRFSLDEPEDVSGQEDSSPFDFHLYPPYPNPFNERVMINYRLPEKGAVRIGVFDLTGRQVADLVDREETAGIHRVEWNAEGCASGIYYIRLISSGFSRNRKIVLIR